MASSTALSSGRDDKIVDLLSMTLQRMDDFKGRRTDATAYAVQVVAAVRARSDTDAEFKDHVMGIVANVKNLNGELAASSPEGSSASGISAAALAAMETSAMLSAQQRKAMAATFRKRAREQTNVDKTSLHCTKCGLVRRNRLNINELALDSEESGSHFDYNFDNVCTCTHSSDAEDSSSDEEEDEDSDRPARPRRDSATGSDSDTN